MITIIADDHNFGGWSQLLRMITIIVDYHNHEPPKSS